MTLEQGKMGVRLDPTRAGGVLVLKDGKALCSLPWQAAEQLGKFLISTARLAHNELAAPAQVMDQAILMRAGFPVALGNNPALRERAALEAQWNRDLRRSNLNDQKASIPSRESFGLPTLVDHSKRG